MSESDVITNPWLHLPSSAPFAPPEDLALLERFNLGADENHQYHLELLPEPFVGRPEASIFLLGLNPGFNSEEQKFHDNDDYFRTVAHANLSHEISEYPFYFLDPRRRSPGHSWWQKRLRGLLEMYGNRTVAQSVTCLEFFPYHSASFDRRTPLIPSQEYTFHLLRSGIARNAVIIIMRAESQWREAVPELGNADVHSLNSNQAVYVTYNNCPTGFSKACEILTTAGKKNS